MGVVAWIRSFVQYFRLDSGLVIKADAMRPLLAMILVWTCE